MLLNFLLNGAALEQCLKERLTQSIESVGKPAP